jgi:hypothetical protein
VISGRACKISCLKASHSFVDEVCERDGDEVPESEARPRGPEVATSSFFLLLTSSILLSRVIWGKNTFVSGFAGRVLPESLICFGHGSIDLSFMFVKQLLAILIYYTII